ncbi:hypothetical protein C0J52_13396, partial [Blattella germanica]
NIPRDYQLDYTSFHNQVIFLVAATLCPEGEEWGCAIPCSQLCLHFEYELKKQGYCQIPEDCIPGCRDKNNVCGPDSLWRDGVTCVKIADCTCATDSGKLVKPGSIVYESQCKVCQCTDNQLECDDTICSTVIISGTEKTLTPPEIMPQGSSTFTPSPSTEEPIITVPPPTVTPPPAYTVWKPLYNNGNQYLEVDLLHQEPVYGTVVSGNADEDEYVTSYQVLYSNDGIRYAYIVDAKGYPAVFRGPVDNRKEVLQQFVKPVEAQYIRWIPLNWNKNIAMKVELLGCPSISTISTTPEQTTTTPYVFPTTTPEVCQEEMGLEDHRMADEQFSASSVYKGDNSRYGPSRARLNGFGSWVPITNSPGQWIQFDFMEPSNLTGIVTQDPKITSTTPSEITTPIPPECTPCPGWQSDLPVDTNQCQCAQGKLWNGEQCVHPSQCPCYVGYYSYPIGTIFDSKECKKCVCKIGGVVSCSEKVCPHCGPFHDLEPFQELTLIDLYDTTGRGWVSGSGLTHGEGGEPDALDLLMRWGGATCSGPTQIRDVQDMSHVVTGKIDHGALGWVKGAKMSAKGGVKAPLRKTNNTLLICEEYECFAPCNVKEADKCPPSFTIHYTGKKDRSGCQEYRCIPPSPPPAICNVTGNSFNTFDGTDFNYEICNHILARDLSYDLWDISAYVVCNEKTPECTHHIAIIQDELEIHLHPDLSVVFNGYKYTIEQLEVLLDNQLVTKFPVNNNWLQMVKVPGVEVTVLIPKIQLEVSYYYHNFAFSVRLPSHTYGDVTEGLCVCKPCKGIPVIPIEGEEEEDSEQQDQGLLLPGFVKEIDSTGCCPFVTTVCKEETCPKPKP